MCRFLENKSPSILSRSAVKEPLSTSTLLIDNLIPIGRGQKELIIGDRNSGKTSLALTAIINQSTQNS